MKDKNKYLIGVNYDSENKISELKQAVFKRNSDSIMQEIIWTRGEIISLLEAGKEFKTAYKTRNGNWKEGDDVGIVEISGEEYLRTDGNHIKSDNLGELPEF